jgi:MFS family permease
MGALIAAPIADRIGRRLSVTVWCGIVAVGFIVQISASHHWYQVMIGRWVSGLGVGALSLLVPMYQGISLGVSRSFKDADPPQLRRLLAIFVVHSSAHISSSSHWVSSSLPASTSAHMNTNAVVLSHGVSPSALDLSGSEFSLVEFCYSPKLLDMLIARDVQKKLKPQ